MEIKALLQCEIIGLLGYFFFESYIPCLNRLLSLSVSSSLILISSTAERGKFFNSRTVFATGVPYNKSQRPNMLLFL